MHKKQESISNTRSLVGQISFLQAGCKDKKKEGKESNALERREKAGSNPELKSELCFLLPVQ